MMGSGQESTFCSLVQSLGSAVGPCWVMSVIKVVIHGIPDPVSYLAAI